MIGMAHEATDEHGPLQTTDGDRQTGTEIVSIIGTSVARSEDPAFLTVGGKYIDDLAPENALFLTFVRSVMAHATLSAVATGEAKAMPGVVAVLTASDLDFDDQPGHPMLNQSMRRPILARDRVRYVGESVAVVVSHTREQGVDAAELVEISYEGLPVVLDPQESLAGTTLLFPEAETNVSFAIPRPEFDGDIFADCEVRVDLSFRNHRLAPCPLEGRSTIARWDSDAEGREVLTQWSSTQGAHATRDTLATAMGVETDQVRVIAPDIGGGFGAKNGTYPEDIVAALVARKLQTPVRWAETRSEGMVGLVHGRGQDYVASLGGTKDGRVSAYRLHVTQDGGAYPEIGSVLPFMTSIMTSGSYDIANVEFSANSVMTNTVPIGAYRGAGRPEAAAAIERMMDLFAAKIGLDPVEIRKRNFHQPEAFPLTTPTGANMDTGEYAKALDAALEQANYEQLRKQQAERLTDPQAKLLGIGVSCYVEIANPMASGEYGSMEVRPDGSALVLTGSSAHGQGHHTAFAQVASEVTGIAFDQIEVRHGDTAEVPRGGGTGGSKSMQVGGSAVMEASQAAVDLAKEVAAQLLEANPADIVLDAETGRFSVAGTPALARSWAEVATAYKDEDGSNLRAEIDFNPPGATFPFGAHVAVVEVDRLTGEVDLLRHIACDDAGTMINPMLVEGQVHGGIASGAAQALMEEFSYDELGNPLTANFMSYPLLSAAELPSFERVPMETPTPRNPLGAKGIGESATIGSTPAVQNAVVDALTSFGIRHLDIPATPQRVWAALNSASTQAD